MASLAIFIKLRLWTGFLQPMTVWGAGGSPRAPCDAGELGYGFDDAEQR